MVLVKYIIGIGLAALTLFSCSNKESLQRYLVDKQDDNSFIKIDIATSLLQSDNVSLSKEEKEIFETAKKINVVAYPLKGENIPHYAAEKQELENIINQDKYKTLIKYGSKNKGAVLKYLGKEESINEIIVFASDNEKGFVLFRLLGDNMNPAKMIKLMNAIEKGDIDISKLDSVKELFIM